MEGVKIRDLAVVGDQKTCAIVSKNGSFVWYCPRKFDNPALFASVLDTEKGGAISFHPYSGVNHVSRKYIGDSAILKSVYYFPSGSVTITDFMPVLKDGPEGLVRLISESPVSYSLKISASEEFVNRENLPRINGKALTINNTIFFYSSHDFKMSDDGDISVEVAANERAWLVVLNEEISFLEEFYLNDWYNETNDFWREVASHITYHGPYEKEVAESIRAIRLLTHQESGGIIAAATTSLPEVIGGSRNYDYRYTWLRDSGMIVSALIRAGSDGVSERRFLSFICDTAHLIPNFQEIPLFTVSKSKVPGVRYLDLAGYENSRPVQIGNDANDQLQLDSLGNILIAAKLIYNRFDTKEHWDIISDICDYLVEHWHQPDHGLWEESTPRHFTSSKVIVSKGLEFISKHSGYEKQSKRWMETVNDINKFIEKECKTSKGEYAAYAGGEAVDVSAALFPLWDYNAPDTPSMRATIAHIEKYYCKENLYWRYLEDFDSAKEGAFLAGTFWMAQYYVMREELNKARMIIDSALKYATDLGFFSEEADPLNRELLGNFPQTFVHASFIGAVIDYKEKCVSVV